MRICACVVNSFIYDTRVQKEAKALAQAGHQVSLFALHGPGLPQQTLKDGYRVEWIHVRSRSWGKSAPLRLLKYVEFCLRYVARAVRMRPSLIHAHDVNALVPSYFAARMGGAKLVYDAHELWAERRQPLLRASWLRKMVSLVEGALARRCDAVITVNPSLAEYLATLHHIDTPTVVTHCQEYHPIDRSELLRDELNIPANQHIIIYPGLLAPGRGLENLILAAEHLDRAVVVLMGRDRLNGALQRLVEERGSHDRVLFHPAVPPEDVQRYVASADLGVMPTQNVDRSYYYGAGNKLYHFLAAGIPAAVSNHPEKRRVVETYGVGAVFDETDPVDIARTINRLLNDQGAYTAMSSRAREAARTTCNWQVESRKLVALYEGLLGAE
jgi:glycosyltransferase involved in cell wall biosynthesis